jgi:hypothetical protein
MTGIEGIDEDGQTKFFHELTRGLFDPNKVPEADLRRYDLNVVMPTGRPSPPSATSWKAMSCR